MCGESKRLADFAIIKRKKRAADPKRYSRKCKKCTRAPSAAQTDPNFKPDRRYKAPVKRTPEEKREYNAEYKRRTRRLARIKSLEYLAEKGCCDCGTRDPRVLEFDHLDPSEKSKGVCRLLCDGYSWASEKLRQEIRKCRVICANCHRLHTIVQQGHYAHTDVQAALQEIDARYDIGDEGT